MGKTRLSGACKIRPRSVFSVCVLLTIGHILLSARDLNHAQGFFFKDKRCIFPVKAFGFEVVVRLNHLCSAWTAGGPLTKHSLPGCVSWLWPMVCCGPGWCCRCSSRSLVSVKLVTHQWNLSATVIPSK